MYIRNKQHIDVFYIGRNVCYNLSMWTYRELIPTFIYDVIKPQRDYVSSPPHFYILYTDTFLLTILLCSEIDAPIWKIAVHHDLEND